jgi:diaminopimelate decarboxylase
MYTGERSNVLKYFDTTRDKLYIGGYTVLDIVEKYNTPLYVYDGEIIKMKYNLIKNYLPNFDIFYSMKANPNISICSLFKSLGAGVEVASGGELHLALKVGFRPEDIIFVGPGKTNEEIKSAIKANIYAIVAESVNELKRIDDISKKEGKNASVMIRINTKTWRGLAPEIMVGGPSKFGIDEEKVIQLVGSMILNNLKIIGIHVYTASQVLDLTSILESMKYTLKLAQYYAEKLNFKLNCTDFGGGWGIPYKEDEKELNVKYLADGINNIVQKLGVDLKNTRLIIELGRYLVAESGIYLTKIIDIKKSRGKKFVITDGGINQQIRPAFMKLNHPTKIVNKLNQKNTEIVDVVGPLCTPLDVLAKDIALPNPEIGDIIGIFNSGAYGFSMSMLNFHSHPWPAEVLIVDGKVFLIRERGTHEKVMENQILIKF